MIGAIVSIGLGIRKAGKWAGEILRALGWKRAAVIGLVIVAIALGIRGNIHEARADRAEAKAERLAGELELEREARKAEIEAHRKTKADYRAAQIEAARLEAERLAAAERKQEGITNEISRDYRRRLDDLRARFQRLRDRQDRERGAAIGAPGVVPLPGVPHAPGRAHETAERGFPRADRGLELERDLAPSERLIAAEQALQLESLIDWIEAQAKAAAPE